MSLFLKRLSAASNFSSGGEFEGFFATGGNEVYEEGQWRVHKFTSSGTLTVIRGGNVQALVVAGGGAGARATIGGGGGGGAGGVIYNPNLEISDTGDITITIGAGATATSTNNVAANGGNSSISGFISCTGGGGGSATTTVAGSGGSGGGSTYQNTGAGTGTGGQGNTGGGGSGTNGGFPSRRAGGGGGGKSSSRGSGIVSVNTSIAGNGGAGAGYIVGSTEVFVGGGGGGGAYDGTIGSGGIGGGGNGGRGTGGTTIHAQAGTANTGGGGGGSGQDANPANGGSGVVYIWYAIAPINEFVTDTLLPEVSSNIFFDDIFIEAVGGTPPNEYSITDTNLPITVGLTTAGELTGTIEYFNTPIFKFEYFDVLPSVDSDEDFSFFIGATGGEDPKTYTILSSNLPSGVDLLSDGTLTGQISAIN
jgi:hypothetical protein